MPGLNAAFVDIGHKKESFLHYTDMGPLFNSVVNYTKDAVDGKYTANLLDSFELQPEIQKTERFLKSQTNVSIYWFKF